MDTEVVGKVALITGASSGIGAGTARLLAKKGFKLAIHGSNKERVASVAKECLELSPEKYKPLEVVLDFSESDNGALAVKECVDHFGQLDVLVNNAGVFSRTDAKDPNTYDTYKKVMAINLDSSVKASLASVEHLRKTRGHMVFVSSVASVKPSEVGYAYCCSKAAMSSFAKCLAIDIGHEVRVNIISPGPVGTPIFRTIGLSDEMVNKYISGTCLTGRVAAVEEVANTIGFIVTNQASNMHGTEIFLDGGYMIKPLNAVATTVIDLKKAAQ